MKKRTVQESKPQYALFDWIVDLPIIRVLKPLYEWKRGFWIYCFLGLLSTLLDTVVSLLLVKVIPSATVSTVLAWICSTLASFVMFRYFYFDRTNNSFINELLKFVPTRLFTLGFSSLCMFIFVDILDFNFLITKIVLIPITAVLNYITSKLFVFK